MIVIHYNSGRSLWILHCASTDRFRTTKKTGGRGCRRQFIKRHLLADRGGEVACMSYEQEACVIARQRKGMSSLPRQTLSTVWVLASHPLS